MNLIDHFPSDYSPRQSQIIALQEIENAIKKGEKYIICSLPTGAGKSFIPATLANYSREPTPEYIQAITTGGIWRDDTEFEYPKFGVFSLTVSKTLQDQYEDIFDHGFVLKGRRNYTCATDSDFDCETAQYVLPTSSCKGNCPFIQARQSALLNKFAILNYSMFLKTDDRIKGRQFIICDEASDLEDELINHYSLTIEYSKFNMKKLGLNKVISDKSQDGLNWVNRFKNAIGSEILLIKQLLSKNKVKNLVKSQAGNLIFYKNIWERLNEISKLWLSAEYVIEYDAKQVTFTPLRAHVLSDKIFKHANHIILMSATISNPEIFAKSLGIPKYTYIEIDSEFDAKKSPVYCSTKYSMNYSNTAVVLPKLVEFAKELCDKHKNEKGIIHCHNFKVTEEIQNYVKGDDRYLFRGSGYTNEHILKEHKERTDATVLVSPSMDTGVSLDGDLGRFQIIMKAPYLPLSSKRVKKLCDENREWYEYKALNTLIQAMGRCTRSVSDESITYILDGSATALIKRYYNTLPKHIKDRIQ